MGFEMRDTEDAGDAGWGSKKSLQIGPSDLILVGRVPPVV